MVTSYHPETDRPVGRPPRCFLVRDGYEASAEYIAKKLRENKGPHVVEIRCDGAVRVTRRSDFTADEYDATVTSLRYVGTYNRGARCEHLEDDLLHWLRSREAGSA